METPKAAEKIEVSVPSFPFPSSPHPTPWILIGILSTHALKFWDRLTEVFKMSHITDNAVWLSWMKM